MTKKPPPEDDPKQSEKFREAVRELEAAGELNLTEGEKAFERLVGKALPPKPSRSQ